MVVREGAERWRGQSPGPGVLLGVTLSLCASDSSVVKKMFFHDLSFSPCSSQLSEGQLYYVQRNLV